MANVRVYQPPVDPSSVGIETEAAPDGVSSRQVVRAHVRQQAESSARAGRAFLSSSGQQTAGAVGTTTFRGLLSNPSTSGKTLFVYRLDTWSSISAGYGQMLINPTSNLPTTPRPIDNTYVGYPNVAAAAVYFDAGVAMTGGTDSGLAIPIPNGVPQVTNLEAPFILSPGVSLGLQSPFGASTVVVITIYWWEEP